MVEPRQLADGHAVARGDGMNPYKALVTGPEHGSFHRRAAYRVGPVENDCFQPMPCSFFHAEEHGRLKRVVATPHVLQIDYQRVQAVQLLGGRSQAGKGVAIKTVDAKSRLVVISDADEILGFSEEAVLRAKQRDKPHLGRFGKDAGDVAKLAINGGRMRQQTDAHAA